MSNFAGEKQNSVRLAATFICQQTHGTIWCQRQRRWLRSMKLGQWFVAQLLTRSQHILSRSLRYVNIMYIYIYICIYIYVSYHIHIINIYHDTIYNDNQWHMHVHSAIWYVILAGKTWITAIIRITSSDSGTTDPCSTKAECDTRGTWPFQSWTWPRRCIDEDAKKKLPSDVPNATLVGRQQSWVQTERHEFYITYR